MNSSSQCKESIKRGATSSSMSELKYMSMLNKAKLKRMREFGNKVNNQYLYPANKFKTLQNKENQQMEVRKSGSCMMTNESKDIDYFQDYLKQTDYEIGYNKDSLKLVENFNEDNQSNISEQKLSVNKDYQQITTHVDQYLNNETILEEKVRARTVMRHNEPSMTSKPRINRTISKEKRRCARRLKETYLGNVRKSSMKLFKMDKELFNMIKILKINKSKIRKIKRKGIKVKLL